MVDQVTGVIGPGADQLERLIDAEYSNALGFALALTRDLDQAQDIVQEAFTRLIGRWVGVREPHAYLFEVIANLARAEWLRQGRPEPVLRIAEEAGDGVVTQLVVREAVWTLPPAQRDVIWLRYFLDLPLGEIARVLDRPEGTVKSLHHHAKQGLAHALGGIRGRS